MNAPSPQPAHSSAFCIGEVSVQVTGERSTDAELPLPLVPFVTQESPADVDIRVRRVPEIRPLPRRQLFETTTTWCLFEQDNEFHFDFHAPVFGALPYRRLITDRSFRDAELLVNEGCFGETSFTAIPLAYPLDELLITHRLTQERAIELHGCGIVTADGTGNLFVGHSGAGKSTTTRLWTATEDVEVLSDDRIIIRENLVREPSGRIFMYGTPWHGEAMFASPASAPLTRILILEHGLGNELTQLSPSQAVAELFARSFVPMHRHEYVESALAFLETVAQSVPCYRYSFEPDQRAVEAIRDFHD